MENSSRLYLQKKNEFQVVFNFEQTRAVYHIWRAKPITTLELHYPTIQYKIMIISLWCLWL